MDCLGGKQINHGLPNQVLQLTVIIDSDYTPDTPTKLEQTYLKACCKKLHKLSFNTETV